MSSQSFSQYGEPPGSGVAEPGRTIVATAVLSERRKTRQLQVGAAGIGSDHPISIQSMTTTLTLGVNATLQQIADIHFQPEYVFAAIEAGCPAVRVNPGNIREFNDQVKEIAHAARDHGTPIRIDVNAGSLDKRIMDKYRKATPEALAESVLWEASLSAEHDFHDIKISVKHNDPVVMVRACEILAEQVTAGLEGMEIPLRVAVTDCVVNGLGEAREPALGVASGNGQIFVKGEVIKTVPEHAIVETLIEGAMLIAENTGSAGNVTS